MNPKKHCMKGMAHPDSKWVGIELCGLIRNEALQKLLLNRSVMCIFICFIV